MLSINDPTYCRLNLTSFQFRVVTPSGKYVVANKCQNSDLFIALRGGGGAFGVVLEATMKALQKVSLSVCVLYWNASHTQLIYLRLCIVFMLLSKVLMII